MDFLTRFAPSPTGYLHLGHAFSALSAQTAARAAGGRLILRIEDIDRARCKAEFEAAIFEDLRWLGIEWEEPVRRQSDHMADYRAALDRLIERGLCYRCFRTRSEILDEIARAPHLAPAGPEGPAFVGAPLSPQEEDALLSAGEPFAWRLSMARARSAIPFEALFFLEEDVSGGAARRVRATPAIFGDVVLGRKDSGASYHLASVHDDALAGVTHVIRGEDLAPAAHLHALLYALLDRPPPVYRHHRLLTDDHGRRLAKRDRAATLRAMRQAGATGAGVRGGLGID